MFEIVNKPITEATEDIILHQVNCANRSGLLAKEIYKKFPEAEKRYTLAFGTMRAMGMSATNLLGEIIIVETEGKTIINMFSQSSIKKKSCDKTVYTNYNAMRRALKEVKEYALSFHDFKSIAIPYGIGTGASNGDWKVIEPIITEILGELECRYYSNN